MARWISCFLLRLQTFFFVLSFFFVPPNIQIAAKMYAKLGFYVNIVFKMTSLATTIYCVLPMSVCARTMVTRKRTDEKKKNRTERVLNYNLNATNWKSTMDQHLNKHVKWFFDRCEPAKKKKTHTHKENKSAICVTNDCNAFGHLPPMVFHILPLTLIKHFY